MTHFDVIIVGAGSAGYVSAIKAAQLGKKVALIEERLLGGTCLNWGCIPTKTLLHVAEMFHQQKDYELLGLEGQLSLNAKAINDRKDKVIEQLRSGIEALIKGNGITLIQGHAKLMNAHTVAVNDEQIMGTHILLATGSSTTKPPIPGIEHALSSDDVLQFADKLFDDVVIIGGGVIGVEFASIYQQLGKKVTVLEAMDRLLAVFDKEISQNLTMILKRRGVSVQTGASVQSINQRTMINDNPHPYVVTYEFKGQVQTITTSAVIVATGRKANGMDSAIELEYEKTRIKVNDNYQTSVSNIYAVGDASSPVQLAHLASHQGIHAICHMFDQPLPKHNAVPGCVYTSPEIAMVGMTEQEAKVQGMHVLVGKYITLGNGKTIIANQDRGFVKIVVDESTRRILGAQLMMDRASDMIVQFAQAMSADLTIDQLKNVIYPHPTFSEAMHEATMDVDKKAIHVMPKKN